jgi:beta-glucosidase
VAGEGAVLLKNDGTVLPLKKDTKIALIGQFAKIPRYQGAGSSLMNPTRLDNLYDELVNLVGERLVSYAPGYTPSGDQADEALIAEALEVSSGTEVVVISAGLTDMYEVEGLDRQHMKLPPGHDILIEALAAVHPKVVVVLNNGSPVEMPWSGEVSAILEAYLGGQAGAGAIADILYGVVNPSGKLAETFPLRLEDNPCYHYFPGGPATVEYRESIYVGYRYYDTVDQDVLYPFGHGLSYTTFEYSDLQLSHDQLVEDEVLTVKLMVSNTGAVPGKEIVQLYVRQVDPTPFRPDKELKGFAKVDLQPGERCEVALELHRRAFAYYDTELEDWQVESGTFEILVGASSRDIRLSASVEVKLTQPTMTTVDRTKLAAYYDFPKGSPVSQADFEALLNRSLPPNLRSQKGAYDLNTPLGDMLDSFVARLLFRFMEKQIAKINAGQEGSPTAMMMESMLYEMPLRTMLMMAGGAITREMLEALLLMINGSFFKGAGRLIKAILSR